MHSRNSSINSSNNGNSYYNGGTSNQHSRSNSGTQRVSPHSSMQQMVGGGSLSTSAYNPAGNQPQAVAAPQQYQQLYQYPNAADSSRSTPRDGNSSRGSSPRSMPVSTTQQFSGNVSSRTTGHQQQPLQLRSLPPNPGDIQTLLEMGFPRAAAVQALIDSNNNVSQAAEKLMH